MDGSNKNTKLDTSNVVFTEGAMEFLAKDTVLVQKVGGGDVKEAAKWHVKTVIDFAENTPSMEGATKAVVRSAAHESQTDKKTHITASVYKKLDDGSEARIKDDSGRKHWHIPVELN